MKVCKRCGIEIGRYKQRFCTECSNLLVAETRNKPMAGRSRHEGASRVFHYGYELPFWLVPETSARRADEMLSYVSASEYGHLPDRTRSGGK